MLAEAVFSLCTMILSFARFWTIVFQLPLSLYFGVDRRCHIRGRHILAKEHKRPARLGGPLIVILLLIIHHPQS